MKNAYTSTLKMIICGNYIFYSNLGKYTEIVRKGLEELRELQYKFYMDSVQSEKLRGA